VNEETLAHWGLFAKKSNIINNFEEACKDFTEGASSIFPRNLITTYQSVRCGNPSGGNKRFHHTCSYLFMMSGNMVSSRNMFLCFCFGAVTILFL
jgi:hypothetical protein